ncbi:LacI family DNA-binding transcriptional regulator [Amylibacter sp.]|nr:LacI family DNA-binding transcriptional regulator [Amylibacter sp.]MDB2559707.1 LacI family DNA-binding transcriptional regulator [Amylibacter sp.]MDC3289736.1 LacI family DNA-binding transcriptional regulator [bacterium]
MQRIGIKDLAKHLGLAEGTVSRALNNYPDISERTRLRVIEAANEMGYRANPAARRLATGVAEAVAYVMPTRSSSISEPFVSQLLHGLTDALSRRGWDLLVVQSHSPMEEEEALKRLITSGKVSGVVLSRPQKVDPRIELLIKAGFPFIVHGRSSESKNYAWYDIDSKAAFAAGVDHLMSLGHQRIGFIGAPTYLNFAQQRLDGYKTGLSQNGLSYDHDLVQIAELSDDGGERAASELLRLETPPTALLCVTDLQAVGALAAVRALDLIPGRDISVIGFDGLDIGRHTNPPLTTMAQPKAHSGRQLGDMLLSIIDGGNPQDFQILRYAELLRRKSDGAYQTITNPKIILKTEEKL